MSRFTTGLIAGGIVGAVGLSYAMSDKRTRKRMMRDGRKVMNKANNMIDNVTDMF